MNLIAAYSILRDIHDHLETYHASVFDNLCHPKDDINQALNVVLEEIEEEVNKLRRKANKPENHGKPCSDAEDARLQRIFFKHFTPNDYDVFLYKVSRKLKRTKGSISRRLQMMGLTNYPYSPEFSERVIRKHRKCL